MPKIRPEEAAEKWARRTQTAVPDYVAGVQRVTESPTAKAAAKKNKMLQKVTEAIQSGKWEQALQRVSLEDWRQATLSKGQQRIAAGVQAAQGKMQEFMADLFSFQERLQAEVHRMPDLTIEDSVNRAVAWIRGMTKFRRSR